MRPSWDDTWMAVAHVMAQRSLCGRAKVGAVIVDARNRVVATGYNGPPAGFHTPGGGDEDHYRLSECNGFIPWCNRGKHGPNAKTVTSYEDCPSLHAELNALSVCDRSVREGGTLYVTSAICFSCAKAVANSGLQRVVIDFGTSYDYRNPVRTSEFLKECGLTVNGYVK